VTIFGYKERPYAFLSADTVVKLAMIRADLDIDTYDLSTAQDATNP